MSSDELSKEQLREILFRELRKATDYRMHKDTLQAHIGRERIKAQYWDAIIAEAIAKGDAAWFDSGKTILCLPHQQEALWRAQHARDK